jgi:hypothetical protein
MIHTPTDVVLLTLIVLRRLIVVSRATAVVESASIHYC